MTSKQRSPLSALYHLFGVWPLLVLSAIAAVALFAWTTRDAQFATVLRRLRRRADPWKDYWLAKQHISASSFEAPRRL